MFHLLAGMILLVLILSPFLPSPIPAGVWFAPRDYHRWRALRWAGILLVVGFTIVLLPALAFAQATAETTVAPAPSPSIVVNIGAIVTYVTAWARDIILTLAGLLVTTFVPSVYRQFITNQALEKGVDFALGAVAGAARGKTLEIHVTSKVLAAAAAYVQTQWPSVADRLGDTLKAAILSRLSKAGVVPAEASAADLGVVPLAKAA